MRDALNVTIHDVSTGFLRMQSLTLEQLSLVRDAVSHASFGGLGRRVADLDREIDELERGLEDACLNAIARFQPLAGDLRFLLTVFRSLADVERVGDYNKHAGRDLEELSGSLRSGPLGDVLPLLALLSEMLEKLAFAFAERDVSAARTVMRLDDDVDALYEQLQRASLTRVLEDPRDLQAALRVSRLARSLERLGDHAVNVAERIESWLSGRPQPESVS